MQDLTAKEEPVVMTSDALRSSIAGHQAVPTSPRPTQQTRRPRRDQTTSIDANPRRQPTEPQQKYVRDLLADRRTSESAKAVERALVDMRRAGTLTFWDVSAAIDTLKVIPKDTAPQPEPAPEVVDHDEPEARDGERAPLVDPDNPLPGVYTVEDADGHVTLRVWQQQMDDDFAPGALLVQYLSGRDNEGDYTGFGFLKGGKLITWKAHRSNPERRYVAAARVLLADPESVLTSLDCPRCHHTLSTPESIARKIGPTCAKAWGWA